MFKFNNTEPIYIQLVDLFKLKIVSGEWRCGSRLPSVRDLALEYGINPNTMQRAMSELEREDLVRTESTNGRFITSNNDLIKAERDRLAQKEVAYFVKRMEAIGCSGEEIKELIQKFEESKKEEL